MGRGGARGRAVRSLFLPSACLFVSGWWGKGKEIVVRMMWGGAKSYRVVLVCVVVVFGCKGVVVGVCGG